MQSIIAAFRWLFTKTYPGGSLFGIPLRIPVIFLIYLPFFAIIYIRAMAPFLGLGGGLMFAAIYIGVLYGSVLAHEFGHAWGTRLVGGESHQIIMTPIGGVHVGTGGLESPRSELIVVALGPAVSILLAGIAILLRWLLPVPWDLYTDGQMFLFWVVSIIGVIASVNVMLTLFNLLFPLFPMDCARLIRGGLSLKYDPGVVTLRLTQVGVGLGIALLVFFFFRVELPIIGPVSGWLLIIGFLGIMACMAEQDRIRQMDVYMRSDNWGGRRVFYDSELVAMAKMRASDDLRGLIPGKKRRGPVAAWQAGAPVNQGKAKKAKKAGPAKVIDIAPLPEPGDMTDIAQLNKLVREAAEREEFELAARAKRRIEELRAADKEN